MRVSQRLAIGVVACLGIASGVGFVAPSATHAAPPPTKTWSGASEVFNWSDPTNWVGGVAPVDGDILVFPSTASSYATQDDIPSLTVAGLTFDGGFQMSQSEGDSLVVTGPITQTATNPSQVIITAQITLGSNTVAVTNLDAADTMLFLGGFDETGGAQPLTVDGPGKVDFQTTDTYTGTTTLDGASSAFLYRDGTSVSPITAQGGSTLGGNGSAGDTSAAATSTIAPGHSPGHLSLGTLTLVSASTLTMELDGVAAGTQYDQISSPGLVSLGNATLNLSLGFSPAAGTTFTLIDQAGALPVTGTFNGLAEGTEFLTGGQHFRITYAGGTGNDVVLTALAGFTTTSVLTSSLNPSAAGASVTFTDTVTSVSGSPTGTVTFLDGSTTIGSATVGAGGVAAFTTSGLSAGTHTIVAQYSGDTNFNGSVASVTQVVIGIAVPSTGSGEGPELPAAGWILLVLGVAGISAVALRRPRRLFG